jgi:hypothetical protein
MIFTACKITTLKQIVCNWLVLFFAQSTERNNANVGDAF